MEIDSTVADVRPQRLSASLPYGARVLLTLLGLALYMLAHWVSLPFVSQETPVPLPIAGHLLVLGLNPLLTGFVLVELFSLLTSPGRRLRKLGAAGRARLNRAALVTSLTLSAIQATGISMALARLVDPTGAPYMAIPGWIGGLTLILTLTAVTAGLFFLGSLLSEYGIGNGFALIFVTETLWTAFQTEMTWRADNGYPAVSSPMQGFGFLLVMALVGVLIRYVRKADSTGTPAFPQGVTPVALLGTFLTLPTVLPFFSGLLPEDKLDVAEPVAALILVPLLSLLTFHLFSSRPRLEANLPEPDEVIDGLAEVLRRRLPVSTLILAVGSASLLAWSWHQTDTIAASILFLDLILVTMVALDVWDQFVFQRRNGAAERLAQLDNVHFAHRLQARLREEGIDALARASHLRGLYFFLGPLFKIDLLVPREDLGRAREVMSDLEMAREVKVF